MTQVQHNEIDPNVGIVPPRTKLTTALSAKGEWQWTLELECKPGDEDALVTRSMELNSLISTALRPDCAPRLSSDELRGLVQRLSALAEQSETGPVGVEAGDQLVEGGNGH